TRHHQQCHQARNAECPAVPSTAGTDLWIVGRGSFVFVSRYHFTSRPWQFLARPPLVIVGPAVRSKIFLIERGKRAPGAEPDLCSVEEISQRPLCRRFDTLATCSAVFLKPHRNTSGSRAPYVHPVAVVAKLTC